MRADQLSTSLDRPTQPDVEPALAPHKVHAMPRVHWTPLVGAVSGVGLLLGIWTLVRAAGVFPDNLFPSVPEILRAGREMYKLGLLSADTEASLHRALLGFVIGAAGGIATALITATTRAGQFVLQPVLRLLAPIPTIGFVPLTILWFGIGESSKYIVVALGVFVPVWINAHAGLSTTPRDYLQVSRCLGASRLLVLRKVVLPEAWPDIIAGLRVGIATAFVLIVVAETTGTTNGLGYRISQAQLFSRADRLIFCLVTLGILGAICDRVLVLSTRHLISWSSKES